MESTILATLEQSATSGEASLSRLLGGGRLNACGKWFIQDPGSRMEEVGKEVREEEEEKQEDKVEVREGLYMPTWGP